MSFNSFWLPVCLQAMNKIVAHFTLILWPLASPASSTDLQIYTALLKVFSTIFSLSHKSLRNEVQVVMDLSFEVILWYCPLICHFAYYQALVPEILVSSPELLKYGFVFPPTLFMSAFPSPPVSPAPKDLHSADSSMILELYTSPQPWQTMLPYLESVINQGLLHSIQIPLLSWGTWSSAICLVIGESRILFD